MLLFGSQARGNSQKFSDYDVLIVLDNDYSGKDENSILDLCYDINLKFDILLDVHIISVKELNSVRGRQPVFQKSNKIGNLRMTIEDADRINLIKYRLEQAGDSICIKQIRRICMFIENFR